MKYIKTKDGRIIDLAKLPNLDINGRGDITWYNDTEELGYMIEYEDIIKTADTIKELCDEFVIKGTRGRYLDIPLQECELRNIPITQIYGAVWCEFGLKYVARMNNEGKLELL